VPTVPLYNPAPAHPDGWHAVTSPGGYEWWYFDAEDDTGNLQIVAIFLEGFVFHPGYLRRYDRYLKRPTRRRPPLPGQYPCAYFVVYERGKIVAQFMTQVPPGEFRAAADAADVRVGPSTLVTTADGGYRLRMRGVPWTLSATGPKTLEGQRLEADLKFTRALHHPPQERTFLSPAMTNGATHQWVIAAPLCAVDGKVTLTTGPGEQRVIPFRGRGYHDHNFGTAPIGPGLRRWIWGRVLSDDRVLTFHHAQPRDQSLPPETHLIEADVSGTREVDVPQVDAEWTGLTPLGLRYPKRLEMGGVLLLEDPQVVDLAPFYLRLTYRATVRGHQGRAFCEVAYPQRLRWPVLGRMIEMSIHRT